MSNILTYRSMLLVTNINHSKKKIIIPDFQFRLLESGPSI